MSYLVFEKFQGKKIKKNIKNENFGQSISRSNMSNIKTVFYFFKIKNCFKKFLILFYFQKSIFKLVFKKSFLIF